MLYSVKDIYPTAFSRKGEACFFAVLDNGYDAVFPERYRKDAHHIDLKNRTSCLLFPDSDLNGHLRTMLYTTRIPHAFAACFEQGICEGRTGFLNYLHVESALKAVDIVRWAPLMISYIPLTQGTMVAACMSYFGEADGAMRRMDDFIGINPRVRREKYESLILAAARDLSKAFRPNGGGAERAGFFQKKKEDILRAASVNLAHPDFDSAVGFEKRVAEKLAAREDPPSQSEFERAVQTTVFPAWMKQLDDAQKARADFIYQHLERAKTPEELADDLERFAFGGKNRTEWIEKAEGKVGIVRRKK